MKSQGLGREDEQKDRHSVSLMKWMMPQKEWSPMAESGTSRGVLDHVPFDMVRINTVVS